MLHRFHAKEHPEQQRIAWDALDAEVGLGHPGRQTARADNFHPVLEDINLYIGSGAVIVFLFLGVGPSYHIDI